MGSPRGRMALVGRGAARTLAEFPAMREMEHGVRCGDEAYPLLCRADSWAYLRFFARRNRIISRITQIPTCTAVIAE